MNRFILIIEYGDNLTYLNIAFFIVSFALLYFGADFLVKGSVSIAEKLNVSRIVIGLTVVALGTSMPEFVISFFARLRGVLNPSLQNTSDISIGNVVGSNIINIALVLGLSAMIRPMASDSTLNKRDMPFLIGITLLFAIATLDGKFSRLDGIIIIIIFSVYMFYVIRIAKKDKKSAKIAFEELPDTKQMKTGIAILIALLGLGLLVGGAQLLVHSGTFLARKMGVSEMIISITMIALGTSLPELFTSVVAAVKGESGISMGNIMGSNIFNLCFVIGLTSIVGPLDVNARVIKFDNWVMLGIAILLLPFLISSKKLIRFEGAILFSVYVLYTANMFLKII